MWSSNGLSIFTRNAETAKTATPRVRRRALQALRSVSLPHQRKKDDVPDRRAVGEQHHQPIDADTFPGGRGEPVLEGADVILVHGVRLEVAAGAALELRLEAAALLLRVVELAEGVRHLEAADVELE